MLKREIIIPIGPSIAYVPLLNELFALIDSEDAEKVGNHNWHAIWNKGTKSWYGQRPVLKNVPGSTLLSRFISPSEMAEIDHKNHNTLDDRKCNHRPATKSQNQHNCRIRKDNKSGVKGVVANGKNWSAIIRLDGKYRYLGTYPTISEAAIVRRNAEVELHGDFRLQS